MKYELNYGSEKISFEIPQENVLQNIEVKKQSAVKTNQEAIENAFNHPVDAPPLEKVAKDKKVVLLVEDATRDVAFEDIFARLVAKLIRAKFVTAVICSGTHDPGLAGNRDISQALSQKFDSVNFTNYEITVHDSRQKKFDNYGTTSIGNTVWVNPLVKKGELFLVLSDMKNHYFAGYSNAIKNFLPGICALETTERNHALALKDQATFGHHPWHPDSARQDNPLAKDMVEGFKLITKGKPAFLLATIAKSRKILWSEYGDLIKVTQNGIIQVDQLMSQTVTPADILIVSSGGYPNDETIYTAQRALELSKAAVKSGGKILFLAECRNGIGPESAKENFFDLLAKPLPEVFALLEKKYIMYSHKAYKFARLIDQCNFLGVHTRLSKKDIESIHLSYVSNPVLWVANELKAQPNLSINLVNDGNKIALHTRNS
jgi:nickel-dependent lactate racemase